MKALNTASYSYSQLHAPPNGFQAVFGRMKTRQKRPLPKEAAFVCLAGSVNNRFFRILVEDVDTIHVEQELDLLVGLNL